MNGVLFAVIVVVGFAVLVGIGMRLAEFASQRRCGDSRALDYAPRLATDVLFDPPKFPEPRTQADDLLDEDARVLLSELDGHHATDLRTVRDWLIKTRKDERDRCARMIAGDDEAHQVSDERKRGASRTRSGQ
jgi:hypothetical protein